MASTGTVKTKTYGFTLDFYLDVGILLSEKYKGRVDYGFYLQDVLDARQYIVKEMCLRESWKDSESLARLCESFLRRWAYKMKD